DVSWGRARLALRARNGAELVQAEQTIRASVIKPTDNKVARFNRRISLPISIALIPTPLTANQLSILLVAVGFYSGWLFSLGTYWSFVIAAFLGLAASILDGCDGEIARLKYQETTLGCWIETVGDYSYYVAIFIGMTVGVARWTGMPVFRWLGILTLIGTFITFALLIYLRSTITAGQPDQLHAIGKARFNAEPSWWTRMVWKVSMVATRSFMPYMIMGLALLGLMPVVMILAAVGSHTYWISLAVKLRALTGADGTLETQNSNL
ncbi:MAG: CDP-alcohol phosphatidyltransferase family protein, partial [Acidobacteriota bacterium]|nr:CDP-alcohol phosphatidyltransferase family protein [Acidobacteriota bacterium]